MNFRIVAAGATLVAASALYPVQHYWRSEVQVIEVTKAERAADKFLVWAKVDSGRDVESFEVTDAWLWFRFNSSDTYGKLVVGKTYHARLAGTRFSLLSWRRNIISAEE